MKTVWKYRVKMLDEQEIVIPKDVGTVRYAETVSTPYDLHVFHAFDGGEVDGE